MINAIDLYIDAGRKAGQAMNENDSNRARFHADWTRRALELEPLPYRARAREAYDAAYRNIRLSFIGSRR